jgi:hypothetical protein
MRQMQPKRRGLLLLTVLGLAPLAASVPTAVGVNTPSVAFNPSTYDYGPVAANTTASKTFVLTNSGGKATGTLKVDLLSDSSTFSKTADTCTGAKLTPKKSCSVTVQYAPTTSGTHDSAQLFAGDIKPSSTFNAFANITGGVSPGCAELNDAAMWDGAYISGGLDFSFKAGETMTMSAGDPTTGSPTGISLTVNSAVVDTDTYPGTVQYTIPADGDYAVRWTTEPSNAGVIGTWTVSCTAS